MLIFPQLSTGTAVQYPLGKDFSQRSIQAEMEDGTIIARPDSRATYVRWRIAYSDLSDQEASSLRSFFLSTQGSLMPFLFLDPTANLLLWSQDFTQGAWDKPGLTLEALLPDPTEGATASRARNNTGSPLTLAQNTPIPGSAQLCFSVYLRAATQVTAALSRTAGSRSQSVAAMVTNDWQRFSLSGAIPTSADPSTFAVTVPAGSAIDIYGAQLDAQLTPGTYVLRTGPASAVYRAARFDMDRLDITATGPNRNGCVVFIRSNVPFGE